MKKTIKKNWIYLTKDILDNLVNLVGNKDKWEGLFAEIEEIDCGRDYITYDIKLPHPNIELYDGENLVKVKKEVVQRAIVKAEGKDCDCDEGTICAKCADIPII